MSPPRLTATRPTVHSIPRNTFARPLTVFAFRPSSTTYSAVKPGSDSEATTPGAGSTEDIAHSTAAYDGDKTNPTSSTHQIERETTADFSSSSANRQASEMATQTQHSHSHNNYPSQPKPHSKSTKSSK